ncbi:lytic polysaccharide monooxygenase [Actinoplanes sp. TFC3]|uniref:lytic polysaccharide monooxygenase n=1 Tax=Actinoplanes sp. TFC3 TaxID=1710355 RepID=UPI00082A2620|nr:lytic polysaccharide monooxygenase [Actinoplanes sp. TFC3]
MRSLRTAAALVAGGLSAAAALPAVPALAHGAPTTPISRTAACAGGGEETSAAACKAARKATGGQLGSFDNLRIANVNGNDKKVVPDGQLCSGGLEAYRGLDLARDDWPSTAVTAGKTLSVRYAGTIPHQGSFRLYLTEQGYDPSSKLAWSDLTSAPVATFKDPQFTGGAYRMSVKIPKDRSGRHVLYVVWETSSTPDTYYSCSDLDIKAVAAPAKQPAAATVKKAAPSPAVQKTSPAVQKTSPASPAPEKTSPKVSAPARTSAAPVPRLDPVAADAGGDDRTQLGHAIIAGALVVIAAAGGAALIGRLRRR